MDGDFELDHFEIATVDCGHDPICISGIHIIAVALKGRRWENRLSIRADIQPRHGRARGLDLEFQGSKSAKTRLRADWDGTMEPCSNK